MISSYVLPGATEGAVAEAVERAAAADVFARIARPDATLWAPADTPEVADRLGWLDVASRTRDALEELDEVVASAQADGLAEVVVFGMGGSSLAPEVFRRSFGEQGSPALTLYVLDTTEPLTIEELENQIFVDRTLFVVSSKSGGTIEPNSLCAYFWDQLEEGDQFVAVTDPDTELAQLADEYGFRHTFFNDPEIGGRYSALSWFGIVPAALAGVDVRAVLDGAIAAERASEPESGLWLGAALGGLANAGRDKLAFVIDPPLESLGLWAEQLIAESTGKAGRGVLPIADEPLGTNYGDDRVFLHVRNAEAPDAENAAAIERLGADGHPTFTIDFSTAADLGRIFYGLEYATAVLGWALGINPFDQPDVQEAKDNTARVLAEGAPDFEEGELGDLFADLAPPHYLSIQGYLPYDEDVDWAVGQLRAAVTERFGVATTWGYGPRFLHSTGQFHKGGPPVGRFLQLVHDSDLDFDIPEEEEFGFRELIDAQADGDLRTLRDHGLTAVRFVLPARDLAGTIDRITSLVRQ